MDSLRQMDIDVFRALNLAGDNSILDLLMVAFTIMGISYVIALVAIPLWMKGKREAAFDVILLLVVVTVVTEVVKIVVDRQRPSYDLADVQAIVSASGPSFPSAHASRAFAAAFLIATCTRRRWGVTAFFVASLIGLSRVYLGVHWPSDILFGAILGVVIAAIMILVARKSSIYQKIRKATIRRLESLLARDQGPNRSANERAVEM